MNTEEKIYFEQIELLWKTMENPLQEKLQSICKKMSDEDAKNNLQESFKQFSLYVNTVKDSIEQKDPAIFSQFIKDLHDFFKDFFRGFRDEMGIQNNDDLNITNYKTFFYTTVHLEILKRVDPSIYSKYFSDIDKEEIYAEKGRIPSYHYQKLRTTLKSKGAFYDQTYLFPNLFEIMLLIRTLRDSEEHRGRSSRDKPFDYFSRQKSFGNYLILSSIFILSIYAFRDLLEMWTKIYE